MKKFLVLTSVLAIAACGGGGGGSGGSGSRGTVPTRAAITEDSPVVASNAAVTSMASEILVGNGTAITPSVARSANTQYEGHTYKSYRLDDVTFKFSGEDSIIRFGLDEDGRIISAGKYDKGSNGKYALSEEGTFTRTADNGSEFGSAKTMYAWAPELAVDSDELTAAIADALDDFEGDDVPTAASLAGLLTDKFDEPFEVTSDNSNIDVGAALANEVSKEINKWAGSQPEEWRGTDWLAAATAAAIEYYQGLIPDEIAGPTEFAAKLNIKGANIGLKYADLGFAELQITERDNASHVVQQTFATYAGGYKAVERNVGETTEFTGTALAGLDHRLPSGDKDGALVRDDHATLTMNANGTSVLEMENLARVQNDGKTAHSDGSHWYSLTVYKNANGAPKFVVGGENTIEGYDLPYMPTNGTVDFAVDASKHDGEYVKHYYEGDNNEMHIRYGGSVENHAYGTSATDIEATSQFGFGVEDANTHEEVAIYGVFGGKPAAQD